MIGDSYKAVEHRLLAASTAASACRWPLPATLQGLIKAADRNAAFLELTRLAGFALAKRGGFGQPPESPPLWNGTI